MKSVLAFLLLALSFTAAAQQPSGTHRLLWISRTTLRNQQLSYESQNTAEWTITVRNRSRHPVSCPSIATIFPNEIQGGDPIVLAPRQQRRIVIRSRMMNLEGAFSKTGFLRVRGIAGGKEVEEWYRIRVSGVIAPAIIYLKREVF